MDSQQHGLRCRPSSKNVHPCRPSQRVAESSLEEKSEDPQDQTGGRAEVSLAAWPISDTNIYLHVCVCVSLCDYIPI